MIKIHTTTDSLAYEIQTEDVYADMKTCSQEFDFSDYPKGEEGHWLYDPQNCKVLGKFKDESFGRPIAEFVGLRAKMYSLKLKGGGTKKVLKGVGRKYVEKHCMHEAYYDCLTLHKTTTARYRSIRSTNQHLKTIPIVKLALSSYDDKRYLTVNGHDTLAYGHWRTRSDAASSKYDHLRLASQKAGLKRSYC